MSHPSVETLLAGDSIRHVERCDTCRRLAKLLGVEVKAAEDLERLPAIDDTMYTEWSALAEGRGGMGSIFRARDRRLGRFVAVKQLRADLDAGERAALRGRFEREARLTARLQHPAIVGVYEAGQFATGEPFYAMPLLRGIPLALEIERRASIAERLGLLPHLTTIAEAVAYAHGEGIVHRDIKPDNVLIGTFGETVLIDWGLAKDLADPTADEPGAYRDAPHDGLTQLGVGTPQYMPPEQARGDVPDPRVDVYALGATIYHALAGRPPYGEARATTVRRELAHADPDPMPDDVPRELVDIVERAMARDPGTRFASAQALADELRRYQTGQLLTTRRYTVGELLRHFARRYRVALRIGAVALLAVAVLAVIAVVRITRERDRAEDNQRRAERELRRAQGTIASARAKIPAQRLEAIALGVRSIGPELRAGEPPVPEAWQGLVDGFAAGPPLIPLAHTGVLKKIVRAGTRLVGVDDSRVLVVWNPVSGEVLARHPLTIQAPESIEISPDARHAVVFGYDPRADVFDLETGARQSLDAKSIVIGANFLPDGRLIAVADDVTVRDPATLDVVERHALPAAATTLGVSTMGKVAVGTIARTLWLWEPGQAPRTTELPVRAVSARFDGETVLVTSADQVVRGVAFGTLATTTIHTETTLQLGLPVASPDHRFLSIVRFDMDNTMTTLVIDRANQRSFSVEGLAPFWYGARWVFSVLNGPYRLFDLETRGGTVLELTAHTDMGGLWIDGTRVATTSRDGSALLWDLASGLDSGLLLGPTAEIVALRPRAGAVLAASRDGTVHVWQATGVRVIRARAEITQADWVGGAVVTGDLEGNVQLFDLERGRELAAIRLRGPISALAVATTQIALGSLEGSLELRDPSLGSPRALANTRGAVTAIALSPDGTLAASAHADGSTQVWEVASGSLLATATDKTPLEAADEHEGHTAIAFSTDGARIYASRPAGSTLVFDRSLHEMAPPLEGRLLAIHGTQITTAALDGGVFVHDPAVPSRRLRGHRASVTAAAMAGPHLATAGIDGAIRLWNAQTPMPLLGIEPHLGAVTALAFLDDDALVIGHESGAVRILPATPQAALARACKVLARFGRTGETDGFCAATAR